ncbi:hypothetical protein LJK88_20580 [Paenibacillus sp. P26]|nr:hypothetical protein LJK88_38165 [Paenibacillus sp. P26]UUZ85685.1 hypothetical protein LJK88_20580 [Paenibacillus sp. P26]
MTETVLNDVITIATTALTTIGGLLAVARKWPTLVKLGTFLEQHAETIVKDAATVIEAVSHTNIGEKIEESIADKLKKSEIMRHVAIGASGFGVALESLSDVQKAALAKVVAESVPAEWGVKQEDVLNELAEVQRAVELFNGLDIVKAANFFTEAQKSPIEPPMATLNTMP